jgi:hypothetical protein
MFFFFINSATTHDNHPLPCLLPSIHSPKQFFDESIIAKLNRSKTQLKKGDTAFLDDMRDVITETFNPPPPSNWYVRAGLGNEETREGGEVYVPA